MHRTLKSDAILGFAGANPTTDDVIDVRALGTRFDTIAEILAAATEFSGTTVINFGNGNQLYLYLVPKSASDFIV
jgi:hypothetical protein